MQGREAAHLGFNSGPKECR